ncbi:MAG: ATP-binding protein [Gammaproteobacteria bacterium]|nr:ATP-binding protein [Gammaproteobacteria bacterium]
MKLFGKVRGLRLATKLALVGPVLVLAPLFVLVQQVDLESVFVEAQAQSMLRAAQGVSVIFNGREDLFENLAIDSEDYEPIYATPLLRPVRLDGEAIEWQDRAERTYYFGREQSGDASFTISIGERDNAIYGYMRVRDDRRVYRDARVLRLDNSDQVRLDFLRYDGRPARLAITSTGPGIVSAYDMDEAWQFARSGRPENRVRGWLRETEEGFALEFRVPTELLAESTTIGFSFVDVDDGQERNIRAITQSLPTTGRSSFNLVLLKSTELLNILEGLGFSDARISVIDADRRLRAASGVVSRDLAQPGSEGAFAPAAWLRRIFRGIGGDELDTYASEAIASEVIQSALAGAPSVERRRHELGFEVITAAYPIVSAASGVLGAVVVEQSTDRTLAMQSQAIDRLFGLVLATFVLVMLALFAFAARLAWRIGHLRRDTGRAIDEFGRLQTVKLKREQKTGDEVGDLARSISTMLSDLQRYTGFLERMPRTLRHEIHNPLNTLSTSLENLADEVAGARDSKYLAAAQRGVARIGAILQGLADAASLEESLKSEMPENCDIAALIANYVYNTNNNHPHPNRPGREFRYRGANRGVIANIPDYRVEQILDKLIDNAIDFGREDSPILVALNRHEGYLRMIVANRGPVLPEFVAESLFDSMVSHRETQDKLHFGLGLYIVRIIAEYHGGRALAMNLADRSGVMLIVELPLIEPNEAQRKPQQQGEHEELEHADTANI